MKKIIKGIMCAGMIAAASTGSAAEISVSEVLVNGKPAIAYRVYLEEYPEGKPPQIPVLLDSAENLNPDSNYKINIRVVSEVSLAEVIRILRILAGGEDGE